MLSHVRTLDEYQGLASTELGMQDQLVVSPQDKKAGQNTKFGCPLCGEQFQRKVLLDHHKKVHTGEKLYKCHVCGRVFCRINNRNTHMRYCSTIYTRKDAALSAAHH